jgi:nitrite reductase (NADH) small subunit
MSGWQRVCALADIPPLGARVVKHAARGDIALFRNAEDEVFALRDACPHRGGPLSQGIVFGRRVACPLHGMTIGLADGCVVQDGCAMAPGEGCAQTFPVRVEPDGSVWLADA